MTWEDWFKLLLQSNVVAAVIVGIFGLVTLRLGIAKFASEKWWERKAESYASVIEGLHKMHRCYSTLGEAAERGYEYQEDFVAELNEGCSSGYAKMQRGENIGSFLMTKEAVKILTRLRLALDDLDDPMDPIDQNFERAKLVTDAIIAMTAEAKNDLKTR